MKDVVVAATIWCCLLAPVSLLAREPDRSAVPVPPVHPADPAVAGEAVTVLPAEEFSAAFVGIYRKLMEIEAEIERHATTYGLDYDLARAVCLYESGGNADLSSSAGAQGYFQLMPATYRSLRVQSNIEAGVKYLSQLVRQFEREDLAVAAYNTGPARVAKRRPMPLETLQYVIGVGHYRSVLKQYESSIRIHAQRLGLASVRQGDTWGILARRVGISIVQLRLHNPFLAARPLRAGQFVAHPTSEPRVNPVAVVDGVPTFLTRHGDNYFNVAFTFDVELDGLREANSLWRLQPLPAGLKLTLPMSPRQGTDTVHVVQAGEELDAIARRYATDEWRLLRDNGLLTGGPVAPGATLRIRATKAAGPAVAASAANPTLRHHRVARGETLSAIARRYGTSVAAIQRASALGSRTQIQVGQTLRIPAAAN